MPGVLGGATGVPLFALSLTTALGLGLGIGYGLLIVSRLREEIAEGDGPRHAAMRTVRTAGRTIVFSALTICAVPATLLVFPPKSPGPSRSESGATALAYRCSPVRAEVGNSARAGEQPRCNAACAGAPDRLPGGLPLGWVGVTVPGRWPVG